MNHIMTEIIKRLSNLMLVMTSEEVEEMTDKFRLLEIKYGLTK